MVLSVSQHNKKDGSLKTGQCAQYGAGMGGVLPKKKKILANPPDYC